MKKGNGINNLSIKKTNLAILTLLATGFILTAGEFAIKNQDRFNYDNGNLIKKVFAASSDNKEDEIIQDKTFDIRNLVLGAVSFEDDTKLLFIFEEDSYSSFLKEYHGLFSAWYNLHNNGDQHCYACNTYEHVYLGDICPLYPLLTDDEKEKIINKNDSTLTTQELDEILFRLRNQYPIDKDVSLGLVIG